MDTETVEAGTNWTLRNGVRMERSSYGYGNMNISAAPSLSYNGTEVIKASLFDFFVIYFYEPRARAVEVVLHWCINKYNVTVDDNVAITRKISSQTTVQQGETFIQIYNETGNVTYLVTPDEPGATYVADGDGIEEIWNILNTTLSGYYVDLGDYALSDGNSLFATAISRATDSEDSQVLDDSEWAAMRNVSQNIANGLTNAYAPATPTE